MTQPSSVGRQGKTPPNPEAIRKRNSKRDPLYTDGWGFNTLSPSQGFWFLLFCVVEAPPNEDQNVSGRIQQGAQQKEVRWAAEGQTESSGG